MSDQSIVEVTQADPMDAIELWFFRDLRDEQRTKLLGLIYGVDLAAEMLSLYVQRQFLRSAFSYSRIAEREACAMVAEDHCAYVIAAAIRARSDRVDDISYAGVWP